MFIVVKGISALKEAVEKVESQAHLLESLAASQLQRSGVYLSYVLAMVIVLNFLCCLATEYESMQLLLQNVQNLSLAVQSLLKAIGTASLERHDKGAQSLAWIQKKAARSRGLSIALKKKELKGGECVQLLSKY